MKQLTFSDIERTVQLSPIDRRVLSLLRESNTQAQTARKLRVSRGTVCQIVRRLEKAQLICRRFGGKCNYNILYDVLDQVKVSKDIEQKITTIRVHNVSRKRKILTPHYQLSVDKRTGYEKNWMMRGRVRWYKYWYPGGVGEPSISLHITPKTIIGYLDAKQYVIAESVEAAEDKAKQYVDKAIEKFVQVQAEFGNQIRIEGVSVPISKIHYGGAAPINHPAMQEVFSKKVPGWFGDESYNEMGINGIGEPETLIRKNALMFERAMRFPDALPDLLKSTIEPLSQSIDSMTAHIQAGTTAQFKLNEQNTMILHLMAENRELRKRIEQLEGK